MRSRVCLFLLVTLATGCHSEVPGTEQPAAPAPASIGTAFDAARTGTITGRVTWPGEIPNPAPFLFASGRPDGIGLDYHEAPNPNAPKVDPKTRGVAGAVVFLRGIDPSAARPWDLPPVEVEMSVGQIHVTQGDRRDRVGFVRRGEAVTMLKREPMYHVLRGRGDAFFSVTLPEANRPVRRSFANTGRVELSSGTNLYWARADLFVVDHPYYTVTDADGRYRFDRVPAGRCEVGAWLPGWESARMERDPDSTAITRMVYTAPLERSRAASVVAGKPASVDFTLP